MKIIGMKNGFIAADHIVTVQLEDYKAFSVYE